MHNIRRFNKGTMSSNPSNPSNPLSIQLYTLRDLTAVDFAKAVREVKNIGYQAVEIGGFGSLKSAREVRKACDDAGLAISGTHQNLDAMEKDPQAAIDDALALGTKYLIIPWLNADRRKDAAAWTAVSKSLDQLGARTREAGLALAFHNHQVEFEKVDGQDGWDYLLKNTAAHNVKFELDVYWAQFAGVSPLDAIKRLASRVEVLHLKDMEAGPEKRFAPCGTGIIDFTAIKKAAESIGVKWCAVEQDRTYDLPSIEAARVSFNNLKKLGLA